MVIDNFKKFSNDVMFSYYALTSFLFQYKKTMKLGGTLVTFYDSLYIHLKDKDSESNEKVLQLIFLLLFRCKSSEIECQVARKDVDSSSSKDGQLKIDLSISDDKLKINFKETLYDISDNETIHDYEILDGKFTGDKTKKKHTSSIIDNNIKSVNFKNTKTIKLDADTKLSENLSDSFLSIVRTSDDVIDNKFITNCIKNHDYSMCMPYMGVHVDSTRLKLQYDIMMEVFSENVKTVKIYDDSKEIDSIPFEMSIYEYVIEEMYKIYKTDETDGKYEKRIHKIFATYLYQKDKETYKSYKNDIIKENYIESRNESFQDAYNTTLNEEDTRLTQNKDNAKTELENKEKEFKTAKENYDKIKDIKDTMKKYKNIRDKIFEARRESREDQRYITKRRKKGDTERELNKWITSKDKWDNKCTNYENESVDFIKKHKEAFNALRDFTDAKNVLAKAKRTHTKAKNEFEKGTGQYKSLIQEKKQKKGSVTDKRQSKTTEKGKRKAAEAEERKAAEAEERKRKAAEAEERKAAEAEERKAAEASEIALHIYDNFTQEKGIAKEKSKEISKGSSEAGGGGGGGGEIKSNKFTISDYEIKEDSDILPEILKKYGLEHIYDNYCKRKNQVEKDKDGKVKEDVMLEYFNKDHSEYTVYYTEDMFAILKKEDGKFFDCVTTDNKEIIEYWKVRLSNLLSMKKDEQKDINFEVPPDFENKPIAEIILICSGASKTRTNETATYKITRNFINYISKINPLYNIILQAANFKILKHYITKYKYKVAFIKSKGSKAKRNLIKTSEKKGVNLFKNLFDHVGEVFDHINVWVASDNNDKQN